MKKTIFYPLLILLSFALGVLAFNFLIMPLLVRSGQSIAVPEVCGKTEEEAINIIKQANLNPEIEAHRFDPVIEKGKVIIQDPLPGKKVKTGRSVKIIISKGVEKVILPHIIGLDLEKAKQILAKYDMEIVIAESIFSDSIDEGKIVAVSPTPEEEVPKGTKISIKLSLGKRIVIPELTGLKLDEALTLLKENNLIVGEIKEIEGSGEPGTIVMQSPQSGSFARNQDSVNLVIVKKK